MKHLMKRLVVALTTLALCMSLAAPALAAGNDYLYTVSFSMGRQGSYTGNGLSVPAGAAVSVSAAGDKVTVTGLHQNDRVTFRVQDAVTLPQDGKYYVRGLRLSGHDNGDSMSNLSFAVAEDADYVVGYGVKGELVSYTVEYVDTEGHTLADPRTYYGNVGDKPVVACLYFEGYQPLSYNMTKTLSANSAENVFTFLYKYMKVSGGGDDNPATPPPGGTPTEAPGDGGGGSGGGGGGGEPLPTPLEIVIVHPVPLQPTAIPGSGSGSGSDSGSGSGSVTVIDDGLIDGSAQGGQGGTAEGGQGAVGETEPPQPTGTPAPGSAIRPDGQGSAETAEPEELTDIDENKTPLARLTQLIKDVVDAMGKAGPLQKVLPVLCLCLLIFLLVLLKRRKNKEQNKNNDEKKDGNGDGSKT